MSEVPLYGGIPLLVTHGGRADMFTLLSQHRGTSLIRNCHPVGPYSRTLPRLLWPFYRGGSFLYERGTPVQTVASSNAASTRLLGRSDSCLCLSRNKSVVQGNLADLLTRVTREGFIAELGIRPDEGRIDGSGLVPGSASVAINL